VAEEGEVVFHRAERGARGAKSEEKSAGSEEKSRERRAESRE
jgi:hypothetical protein